MAEISVFIVARYSRALAQAKKKLSGHFPYMYLPKKVLHLILKDEVASTKLSRAGQNFSGEL